MKKPHVLLVEVDQLLLDMYQAQLYPHFNVSPVSSAQEAIDVLDSEQSVDVIIMDVLLGNNNGIEILAELRSYDDWLDIPVMVLSSLPESQFPSRAEMWQRYGVAQFLYKPQTTPLEVLHSTQRVTNFFPGNMKRYHTTGIILRRVDYGEADRIITFITPDKGKVSAMAKGVRKPKSKLAGGIELFSESELTLIEGKGSLDHLVSSRLIHHYKNILQDYDHLEIGYKAIQLIEKATEDDASAEYYRLLSHTFQALSDKTAPLELVEAWFYLQLLVLLGHTPNLTHDNAGKKLSKSKRYTFVVEEGSLAESESGTFGENEIKSWRILASLQFKQAIGVKGITTPVKGSVDILRKFVDYTQ